MPLQTYPIFAMSPPFGLSADSPNNVFMKQLSPQDRVIDKQKALQQWLQVYHQLAANGMVALLAQKGGLQDQSYIANLGVVLSHLPDMPIVTSNFSAEERIGEAVVGRTFFESLGAGPVVTCPHPFEGEADCKRIRGNVYAVGVGMRTNIKAAVWFQREYGMRIIPIQMKNEWAYHLDCLMFPIDNQKMMVGISELSGDEIASLERVTSITPVPPELIAPGATNLVRCGRMLLSASLLWSLARNDEKYAIEKAKVEFITNVAADNRLEPCFFNLSEFEKSGAGLSCLVMHLSQPVFADA
jgi:N-dimethylarginine dimethylaminohydrolase